MAMSETKATLRQVFLATKKPPNEKMIEMQRSVLVMIGYDADFGVSCLNTLQRDYPDNRELAHKMQQFALCAQVHCQIACMSDEEKAIFYKDVPIFMHHCPHLFVMQQQMRSMQQQQQQQQGHMHDHSHAAGSVPSMDPDMVSRMQEMVRNPEAKRMMEVMSAKMTEIQPKVYELVLYFPCLQNVCFKELINLIDHGKGFEMV